MSPRLSPMVLKRPSLAVFRELFQQAVDQKWSRWEQASDGFLRAMWAFDRLVESGVATQGDNQNGKGDFFGDLVCVLLENCSQKELVTRPGTPGRIFPRHLLDAAYPPTGPVKILLETKVVGAPRSSRNIKSQKNPLGRPASADMDKRVKEAAFKNIDLKAEAGRRGGAGDGPQGDLIDWLRRTDPKCFMLMAIRVVDDADLERTIRLSEAAGELMDGCGVIAYRPTGDHYELARVPRPLDLDNAIARICQQLRHLP